MNDKGKRFSIILHTNTRKLATIIYNQMNKYKILNNLSKLFELAKNKTQTQIDNNIKNSTLIQELKIVPLHPTKPVPERLIRWWQWYQHLTGLNAVENARQKMILLQDKISNCQDMRHLLREEAFAINNKTKEIYNELLRTRRDDPKYVNLTILENKNLQQQNTITEKLNLLEQEEKNYYLQFTTAINQYQDAQALNAQKYKYLSILASALAAVISLICSMIYNNKKINDIREIILETQQKHESSIESGFSSLEKSVDKKMEKLEHISVNKIELESRETKEEGWLNTFKKTSYVFSVILMLKGLIF